MFVKLVDWYEVLLASFWLFWRGLYYELSRQANVNKSVEGEIWSDGIERAVTEWRYMNQSRTSTQVPVYVQFFGFNV